ncbi:MAG: putative Ig domain-containing protein [Chloroflexi bacterium]|nr:putative Ig domain-containing protein [Chloroflexota bacterium]
MNHNRFAILSAFLVMLGVSLSCYPSFHARGPLEFKPDTLPASQVGVPYETKIHVSQNDTPVIDFTVSQGALPPGLELVRVQGEDTVKLSGIPTQSGTFTFTISVSCYGTNVSGQTGQKEYSIVVEE